MNRWRKTIIWLAIVVLALLALFAGVSTRKGGDMIMTFYGIVPPAEMPVVKL